MAWRRIFRQHFTSLSSCLRSVVLRQSSSTLHLADDRIERAVRMLRGTAITQAHVRFGGKSLQQRRRQYRLANAHLAGEQPTWPSSVLPPTMVAAVSRVLLPAYEVSEPARVERLETAFRETRPQHRPGPRGSGDALEVLCPKVLKLG